MRVFSLNSPVSFDGGPLERVLRAADTDQFVATGVLDEDFDDRVLNDLFAEMDDCLAIPWRQKVFRYQVISPRGRV